MTNAASGEGSLRRRRPLAATLSHLRRGRRALVFVLALGAWAAAAAAQPGFESPAPEFPGLTPLSGVPVLETPPVDVRGARAAARAASVADGPGAGDEPVRFAEPFTVDVSPLSHGRWETTLNGRTAVWRLRVVSEGAVSLNFGFARYWMPPGGRLRVHTPDGAEVLGPYTDADNEAHGELWTPVLSGGDAVIEVTVPVDRIGELDLDLTKVNRGLRDLVSVASPSGLRDLASVTPASSFEPCRVDVACSEGDPYRDQIRSVGIISVMGAFFCTGTLVNNTAKDGKPYFLTARHCFEEAYDLSTLRVQAASVVVYWNYERPACGSGNGTRSDTQTGAVLRVARDQPTWPPGPDSVSDTDTVLLELDDDPHPAHHLYLAGWDSGSSAPASAVGIHHPLDTEKAISFENHSLTRTAYWSDTPVADGDFWRVADWDKGAIESGSSGSALFDPNKRIVGVLRGGQGRCGDDDPVWYGALTASWKSSDGSSVRQLADWLDPGDTGVTALDGMDVPNTAPNRLRALDDKAVKVPGDGETAEALVADLAPFFIDPDGHALTYTATSSDETAVTVSVSGSSVSLTPVASGSATITVTVADGGPTGSVTSTFQVTAGSNRSPETVGTLAAQTLNEGDTAKMRVSFMDRDGDSLILVATSTDTSIATVEMEGVSEDGDAPRRLLDLPMTVTAVDGPGTAMIDVTATDARGSQTKARFRFAVTVLNEPPQAVGSLDDIALQVGDGNAVVDVAAAFTDPENEALTYGISSSAREVVRSTLSGSKATLIPVSRGNATVTVTATDKDGSNTSATQTINVRVKGRRGVSVSTGALTVIEGSTATYTVVLDSEPTGEVTVTPTVVSSTKITVSPSSLTFDATDWQTAQTVTVGGVAAESATIRHAVSGADYGSVTAASVGVTVLGGGGGAGGGGSVSRPRDDHGNTAGRATPIAPNERTDGQLNTRSDVDYFTLTAPQAGVLVVETTGTTATRGTVWQDGTQVATADSGGSGQNFRLSVRVEAGPVVMAVRGNGLQTGPYTLQTTLVVAYLENPAPTSFQSGLGLISGWVCAGEAVTVEIERANGTVVELAAAYGTERADTAAVCDDTDNGFGVLFNWNLLGDGDHAVRVLVDGIELGRARVTVTTLGAEFVKGLQRSVVIADFPRAGEQVRVVWQESQQNFVLAPVEVEAASAPAPSSGGIEGVLENPRPASYQSGLSVISGWVCAAEEVVIEIDGQPIATAAGTERADTLDVCGDVDTGFGLLVNWAEFGAGAHEVVALVDGVELSRATVTVTVVDATEPYVRGLAKRVELPGFPTPGETVTLEWQQSQQNFVITGVE